MTKDTEEMMSELDDLINMPLPEYGDNEPMEVREFRYKLYRVWWPLITEISGLMYQTHQECGTSHKRGVSDD